MPPDRPLTFADYVPQWLATLPATLAPQTVKNYEREFRLRLLPVLGDDPLPSLTNRRVRDLLLLMKQRGATPQMARNAWAALSACCRHALERGVLEHNPAHGVGRRIFEKPESPPRLLMADELPRFMAAVDVVCPELRLLFSLMAASGLRIGEALTLRREDVDVPGRRLCVSRSWNPQGIGPTKSRKLRWVPLDPALAGELGERIARLAGPWLFPSTRLPGRPWRAGYVRRRMAKILPLAGITRWVTPHGLRHGWATFMVEETGDVAFIQKVLGHQSVQLSIDLYARHAVPRQPAAMAALARLLGPTGRHPPRRAQVLRLPTRRRG